MSSRRTSAKATATCVTLIALLNVPTAAIADQAVPAGRGGGPYVVAPASTGGNPD